MSSLNEENTAETSLKGADQSIRRLEGLGDIKLHKVCELIRMNENDVCGELTYLSGG
jgi:hypothetical protein